MIHKRHVDRTQKIAYIKQLMTGKLAVDLSKLPVFLFTHGSELFTELGTGIQFTQQEIEDRFPEEAYITFS